MSGDISGCHSYGGGDAPGRWWVESRLEPHSAQATPSGTQPRVSRVGLRSGVRCSHLRAGLPTPGPPFPALWGEIHTPLETPEAPGFSS